MPLYQPDKIIDIEFYRVILEFLSLVFLEEPTEAIVNQLAEGNPFGDWPVQSSSPALSQGLDTLEAFCHEWTPEQLNVLKEDYARLFLGFEKTLAPPYESVFCSDDHLLFEKQTLEVRAVYQRYGLQVPQKNQIPDDHISYELQFMATICDQLVNAWRGGESAAINALFKDGLAFLDQHLLCWLDDFSDRVQEHAQSPFYRGMALVAAASVRDLRAFLAFLA